ncbi:MAG: hypothetical protein JRI91_06430 [Deltaproteobacteria bacterium]|nr:hypothetical protein [Deltaproteobacteria bacterium]
MANAKKNASTGERSMFEAWALNAKSWETLYKAFPMPETFDSVFKSIQPSSESVLKMTETGWESFNILMGDWQKQLNDISRQPGTSMFSGLDQDALGKWSELYDKEFRKFLNIPQLGLTRFHQEKINHTLDTFVRFQNTMAEFLHLLYKPIEKSGEDMQKKISDLAKNDELPEEPKAYYNIWVKILEKNYMVLFKTEKYLNSLGKTMQAMEEYSRARKEVVDGFLQTFSIPTTKDMDDVYKDMYVLKKRVQKLEKMMREQKEKLQGDK